MSSDIFISYAREDRNRVQPIAEALEQRGYGVWWDKGLRSGEDYRDRIEEMLQTAKCVVVAWSRHSIESDFVIDEAGRGLRRGVLLPVFIDEGIEPPLGFGGTHTTDLAGWLDGRDDAALEQFVGDVESRLTPTAPAHAGTSRPPPRPRAAGGGGLRWGVRVAGAVFAVSGLLFTAAVVRELIRPTSSQGSRLVAAASLGGAAADASRLEGTFRLATWNGLPLPIASPDSSNLLVSATMEVHDAAAAARGGIGRWIDRFTTRGPGGAESTTSWEGRFRVMGDTVYIPSPHGDRRYTYVFGADGGLTMTDVETKQVATFVR
jgi:hypothetical protein